jgi:hypothetical protein
MDITCARCGAVCDGLVDYESHSRWHDRLRAYTREDDPRVMHEPTTTDDAPMSPFVRRARAGNLPAKILSGQG